MKKLNRNGFTLIELLAVIVILAIVMVVTIPSVLNAMDNASESQLQNAADTVAEWFQKNYDLEKLGDGMGEPDPAYTAFIGGRDWIVYYQDEYTPVNFSISRSAGDAVLKAAGVGGGITDVRGRVYLKDLTGKKVCVALRPSTNANSKFKNLPINTEKISSGC